MKHRTAICSALLLIYGCGIARADMGAVEPIEAIRGAAASYVTAQVPGANAEAALDSRLRLAACTAPLRTATFGTPGNSGWTVAVSCEAPAWTLYVPVHLHSDRKVLIATRNLRAGESLTADAFSLESRDTAQLPAGFVSDAQQVVGKILRQPVATGAALSPDAFGSAPSIKRGQLVTLHSQAGMIEVRAEGKALADGGPGDHIRVENESSQRVVEGRVANDGTVEVTL